MSWEPFKLEDNYNPKDHWDEYTTFKEYKNLDELDKLREWDRPTEEMLELMEDGDVLESFFWNAGFLAQRFGWYLKDKNGKYKYRELRWLS